MRRFDVEQLTRFAKYTQDDLAVTEASMKAASGDDFKTAFALMNALNAQADLIQQHIDAPTKAPAATVADAHASEAPTEASTTPTRKRGNRGADTTE